MTKFDNTHITALQDLINSAIKDVIAEYAAVGQAVPSLDTLSPGPFTVPEETPARLTKAIQVIEAACAQLSYTVAPPGSVMVNVSSLHLLAFVMLICWSRNHSRYAERLACVQYVLPLHYQHEEPACLLVVTEARIADLLLNKPGGLPASELAALSGLDGGKLTRILRLLATRHCFKEGQIHLCFIPD